MPSTLLVAIVLVLTMVGYSMGRRRAIASVDGKPRDLHSLPSYYGSFVALWCGVPALLLTAGWLIAKPMLAEMALRNALDQQMLESLSQGEMGLMVSNIVSMATGNIVSGEPTAEMRAAAEAYREMAHLSQMAMTVVVLAIAVLGLGFARTRISPTLRARNTVERFVTAVMIVASTIAILTTAGIVLSLLFESLRFFQKVPITDFLFGLNWSPQTALRADQVGSSGAFGAIPIFVGTAVITVIAMFVAVPIGLFSAIYMSEYAGPKVRATAKPILEVLAGVPTVVYGFFAALTVAPFFRGIGEGIGLDVSSESALAAGVVMGIMIIPFVSSLSDDVMNAVPQTLRDGAYALGATKSETIKQVIVPAALPGIVGSVLLAVSRAIGETMIVVMAAGLAANLTVNPLEAVTTVTVQIVTLLTGDQEFDSAKTLSAFALGLVLFAVTLMLNVVALRVVRKYREKYD